MPAALQQRVGRGFERVRGRRLAAARSQQLQGLLDQPILVAIVDHQVDAEVALHLLAVEARMTAGHHQPRLGITALQTPDLLPGFAVGARGYRAGIEYHYVGLGGFRGQPVTALQELTGPGFHLRFVEAATQRLKID